MATLCRLLLETATPVIIPPSKKGVSFRSPNLLKNNDRIGYQCGIIKRSFFDMSTKPKRVAIYARVSTKDKGQDPDNQLAQLREWCARMGYEIAGEYVDRESGRRAADRRRQFAALFDDAARRKFDVVLFWALDRFSREGLSNTVMHLRRLDSYGVAFHSFTESSWTCFAKVESTY